MLRGSCPTNSFRLSPASSVFAAGDRLLDDTKLSISRISFQLLTAISLLRHINANSSSGVSALLVFILL